MEKGICPICKKPNGCAMTAGEDPYKCWCMTEKVPKGLLGQIPEELRGQSCVCRSCVLKYKEENK